MDGHGRESFSDALTGYRNVLAVVAGLTVLQAAMASLAVIVALGLAAQGASNLMLGFVASCFAGGFLLGTLLSPPEIARIGHIRSYAFFAAIGAIFALGFALSSSPFAWAGIQIVLGLSSAGLLTAGESWVADASPPHRRGAILGFYHLVSKLGAIAGPFLVASAAGGLISFMLVAALFAASLLPVTTTNRAQPALSTATPFGPSRILRAAPAAAYAAFCAGVVNNAVAQLYPVFAASLDTAQGAGLSAQFNAALLAGAMIGLWPAGYVSDRIDRRMVISGLAALGALSSVGLVAGALAGQTWLVLVLAVLFGAGSLSYYAVAVAHAADKASPEQATSMMAGILMIWGLGSLVGPVLAGAAMSLGFGAPGLFVFTGAALAVLSLIMLTRAVRTDAVPQEEKAPFTVSPATSYAIAEFDPRGESEDQLDLFSRAHEDFQPQ